jgi:phosphate transport system permease protein
MTSTSFTGRQRRRRTRRSVRIAERVAQALISIGGVGTILAVALIFVFLVWVIAPLFSSGKLSAGPQLASAEASQPLAIGLDAHSQLLWTLESTGGLVVTELSGGAQLQRLQLQSETGQPPSAVAFTPARDMLALGYADGFIQTASLRFKDRFLQSEEAQDWRAGKSAEQRLRPSVDGNSIYVETSRGEVRQSSFEIQLDSAIQPHGESAVRLVDASRSPRGVVLALLTADGQLSIDQVTKRYDMLEDREIVEPAMIPVPYAAPAGAGEPRWLVLDDLGRRLFVAWESGWLQCYGVGEDERASLLDERQTLPTGASRLTSLAPLVGKRTLALADDSGQLATWFVTRGEDGVERLIRAHSLPAAAEQHYLSLSSSPRSRLLAAIDGGGQVSVIQPTAANLIARVALDASAAERLNPAHMRLAFSDAQDALFASDGGRLQRLNLQLGHPEATLASLFLPVLYEDYPKPSHAWQSTGGSNDFEPKLGMTPLVFGTLKATLYSLLFGAPIALLAAIFTSEYLKGRLRSSVKATLELMASLPSVVLGFLAAILIAPFVRDHLAAVIALFAALPLALLLGAHLWQLLPRERVLRWSGWQRFLGVLSALLLSLPLAFWLGPTLERLLFGGDIKAWLRAGQGPGRAGWWLLFLPLGGLATLLLFGSVLGARIRRVMLGRSPRQQAWLELVKLVVGLVCAGLIALLLAFLVGDGLGVDPRGTLIGPYDERNALVVGFVMGFAIIPIIYTLAEDALSSVPQHLREASLGAGATPWQTAIRVIVPTAMSGLFSALMIGLGRAVGETMIVLMATGGTAIIDWNVFNGFRTLSANIATELPEAAAGSTHYRVLFLAGFVLFLITFILNSLAELVRQRFRRRAFQL